MFYPPEWLTWVEEVSTHLPHLSKTQAQMLAWYSFAVTICAKQRTEPCERVFSPPAGSI